MHLKYPSMDNYYKSVGDLLGERVVVTEKLDGSNFSIHVKWRNSDNRPIPSDIQFRSRNQKANEAEGSLFHEAAEIANGLIDEIVDIIYHQGAFFAEVVFYFEVIGRGIQRRVDYQDRFGFDDDKFGYAHYKGRTIALLDVCFIDCKGEKVWSCWPDVKEMAKTFSVMVPDSFIIESLTLADIDNLLAVVGSEGSVIRAEGKDIVQYTHYGDLKRVKLKTSWFDGFEKKGASTRKAKPKTPPEIIEFLRGRINFGRLHSVYSHGNSELVYEMKDMKYLIDLVVNDIKAEDDSLWSQFDEAVIKKTAAQMLPKVLQGYLLERNT